MNTFLSVAMLLASITITTSLQFTDEELEALYNSPVDAQAFVDTILSLPLTEEVYVYNYINDLIRYLPFGSKLQTFLLSALATMQGKIDDFSARYNLETKPVQDFLVKGIDIQLKILLESAHRATKRTNNESTPTESVKLTESQSESASDHNNSDKDRLKDGEPLKLLPKSDTISASLTSLKSLPKINSIIQKSTTKPTPEKSPNKVNSDDKQMATKPTPKLPLSKAASNAPPALQTTKSFSAGKTANENSISDLAKILEENVVKNTAQLRLPKRNATGNNAQIAKKPSLIKGRPLSTGIIPLANSATPASFSI